MNFQLYVVVLFWSLKQLDTSEASTQLPYSLYIEEKTWFQAAFNAVSLKQSSHSNWFLDSVYFKKTAAFPSFGIDWRCLSSNRSTQLRLLLILAGYIELNPGPTNSTEATSAAMNHPCEFCSKTFKRKSELNRHMRHQHLDAKSKCPNCPKTFSNLARHMAEIHHGSTFACWNCGLHFTRNSNLLRHASRCNSQISLSPAVHQDNTPSQPKRKLTEVWRPWITKKAKLSLPFPDPMGLPSIIGPVDPDVAKVIRSNWSDIRTSYQITNRFQDTYNFRLDDSSPQHLAQILENVHHMQRYKYKLNLVAGFILQDRETGQLKFYYASNNTKTFPTPFTIAQLSDLQGAKEALELEREDLLEHCRQLRPNSKYVIVKISNILVYISKIKPHPIGCPVELPDQVKHNMAIITLERDEHHGKRYTDNHCFFRCLAIHRGASVHALETLTKNLLQQWCSLKQISVKDFEGVTEDELPQLENHFQTNIEVYSLTTESEYTDDGDINEFLVAEYERIKSETEDGPRARKIYRSGVLHPAPTMYLNLCAGHFLYIKDLKKYSKSWQCSGCLKLFPHRGTWQRHERSCNGSVTHKYPGGGYGLPKRIFEQLMEEGYIVDEQDRYYPYRASFDFENYFETIEDPGTGKLQYTQRLIPASVSVASNVPGYENPKSFISTGNSQDLIIQMYDYLSEISAQAYRLLSENSGILQTP